MGILGLLPPSAAGSQVVPVYGFTLMADTSSVFGGFGSSVSLNSGGSVAFFANLKDGGVGIFTGTGRSITTIADTSTTLGFGSDGVASNDAGTVAFPSGVKAGGAGVFAGNGGPIVTIAETGSGAFVAIGSPVSINDLGTVAFLASATSPATEGIFVGAGGPVTTLYDDRTGSPFFTFGSPAINDHGIVAFLAGTRNSGGSGGIFAGAGAPAVTKIADETDNLLALNGVDIITSERLPFMRSSKRPEAKVYSPAMADRSPLLQTLAAPLAASPAKAPVSIATERWFLSQH
jgi:hypothetical protein